MHRSSYCGINCEKCSAYIATINNDDDLKQKIAEEWGSLHNRQYVKEEINCLGCKSEEIFTACTKCDIRNCNLTRGIENCQDCEMFPCDRLQRFFDYHKANKTGSVFV